MAFTTVTNPNGIVHSSVCSDWDSVDANRAVLVTQGGGRSKRLFIQDVITQDGVTTIGDPYFIAQIAHTGTDLNIGTFPDCDHALLPMVRSLGNDLFAVVCAGIQNFATTAGSICIYTHPNAATNQAGAYMPIQRSWIAHLVKRDANGNFSTIGSASIDQLTPLGNGREIRTTFPSTLLKTGANSFEFVCYEHCTVANNCEVLRRQTATFTFTDTSLTLVSNLLPTYIPGNSRVLYPANFNLRNAHEKRLPDGTIFYAFDRANIQTGIYNVVQNTVRSTCLRDVTAATGVGNEPQLYGEMQHVRPSGAGLLVKSFAEDSKDDEYLLHSITSASSGSVMLSHRLLSVGQNILAPLDSAWVTHNIGVTIGGSYSSAAYNVNAMALQAFVHDAAFHVNTGYTQVSMVNPQNLALFFRQVPNGGTVLAGAFDPVVLPYMIHSNRNHAKKMVRRVDDNTFLIFGVFSTDGVDANARLGVITVKVP